jgi:hypothetical protein
MKGIAAGMQNTGWGAQTRCCLCYVSWCAWRVYSSGLVVVVWRSWCIVVYDLKSELY